MVIKSDTLSELKKNSVYSRYYAAALIAHAERIEALIEAESMVADIGAGNIQSEFARSEQPSQVEFSPRAELPRSNRELSVTQPEAIKSALQSLGRPALLGEIFNTIKSLRLPVKLTNAESLRSVMSRSDEFESDDSGRWQLKSAAPAAEEPDQLNGTTSSGENGAQEGTGYATGDQV